MSCNCRAVASFKGLLSEIWSWAGSEAIFGGIPPPELELVAGTGGGRVVGSSVVVGGSVVVGSGRVLGSSVVVGSGRVVGSGVIAGGGRAVLVQTDAPDSDF